MVLYGFGGHCLNITDNCVDLNHVSRPITLSLLTWKASNLVKWQPWTWSLVVMSIYWLVKIWNSPQFPAQFWNGQCTHYLPDSLWGPKCSVRSKIGREYFMEAWKIHMWVFSKNYFKLGVYKVHSNQLNKEKHFVAKGKILKCLIISLFFS